MKAQRREDLLAPAEHGAIDAVFIACPDRLVRLGFGYLVQAFGWKGIRLEALEPPKTQEPTEELTQFMLTIVMVFTGRLYGHWQRGFTSASKQLSRNASQQKRWRRQMGQATRTTKLLLDLGKCTASGANSGKRAL